MRNCLLIKGGGFQGGRHGSRPPVKRGFALHDAHFAASI